ncbi:hypothetical protein GCM10029992_60950 [Glycomyces albus]
MLRTRHGTFDLPLEQLREYRPEVPEPADFDAFWKRTLDEAGASDLDVRLEPVDAALTTVEVFDLTFAGFAGHPIKGWLVLPKGLDRPLPCVVEYIGYSGGRSVPWAHTMYAAAGWAHLVMDTRGQGYGNWQPGDTGDPYGGTGPTNKGWMTQGIESPTTTTTGASSPTPTARSTSPRATRRSTPTGSSWPAAAKAAASPRPSAACATTWRERSSTCRS